MSLSILMGVDQSCVKSGTQCINCTAQIFNLGTAAVTLTAFQVNVSPGGAPISRNVPLPANSVIPANGGSIYVSWGESVIAGTPPASGTQSLQVTVGCTAYTSDGSVAASPNATISVYSMQPPSVNSAGANIPFLSGGPPVFVDPKAVAPSLPQTGQLWFESGFNSGMVPLLCP